MKLIHSLALFVATLSSALPALAAKDGTVSGSVSYVTGQFGQAVTGLNDSNYVVLPASFSALPASASAIEARVKYVNTGGLQGALELGKAGGFWIGLAADGTVIGSNQGIRQADLLTTGEKITDSNYHTIRAVCDANNGLTIYLDGVNTGGNFSGACVAPDASEGRIGGLTFASGYSFAGPVDEVAVWNIAPNSGNYTVSSTPYTGSENGLFALYHLDGNVTDSANAASTTPPVAGTTVLPSTASLTCSPYVWAGYSSTPGTISLVNPGNYCHGVFSGTSVTINYDGSMFTSANYPHIVATVDGHETGVFVLTNSPAGTVTVASNLSNRKHSLKFELRSVDMSQARWTSPASVFRLTGITVDTGATLIADARRSKNILAYGDSIFEGWNATGYTGNTANDQDATASYMHAVGDAADAEVGLVAFAGTGLVNGTQPGNMGDGGVPTFPNTYNFIYSGVARDFSTFPPDLIVINLGTNDRSTSGSGYITPYVSVINALRSIAPNAPQRLLIPLDGSHTEDVTAVVSAVASPLVQSVNTSGWWPTVGSTTDSIDGVHPYGYEHLSVIAPKLFPVVQSALYPSAITGMPRTTLFY